MPVMDGYEASRRIRSELGEASLPIIAMTANALASDRQRCLEAGMDDHIAKPIDVGVLQNTLARWLENSATPEQPTAKQAQEPPAILDLAAALGRLGKNGALYGRLARRFGETQGDTISRLRSLLASGDHQGAILLAHTLRGLAGNLGASRLATLAGELEALLRRAGAVPPDLEERLNGLATGMADALAAIAPHAAAPMGLPAAPPAPAEALRAALTNLLALANGCDAATLGEFEKLAADLRQQVDGKQVDELEHLIANYDFEAAAVALTGIIGDIFR